MKLELENFPTYRDPVIENGDHFVIDPRYYGPAAKRKPSPACPACRKPFVDADGRTFSICKDCPYRIPPKPRSEVATARRVCGKDCVRDTFGTTVRQSGIYRCTACPHENLFRDVAEIKGDKTEVIYRAARKMRGES